MKIYAISGIFERSGSYINIENNIVEATSDPHALSIICHQLTERYYKEDGHWIHVNVMLNEKLRVRILGYYLMDKITYAPADVTLDFLGRYKSKFTRDNLMEIARLTEKTNRRAYLWAEYEYLRRYGKNIDKKY